MKFVETWKLNLIRYIYRLYHNIINLNKKNKKPEQK